MKTGVELIAEERLRQINVEGWSLEHDDSHIGGEMARAAACYCLVELERQTTFPKYSFSPNGIWPWSRDWWKPTHKDRIKELIKAGALIAAEIDRINRKTNS